MKKIRFIFLFLITIIFYNTASAGGGIDYGTNTTYPSRTTRYSILMENSTGTLDPMYSNELSTFTFITRENNKSVVYLKGEIIGKYDAVDNLVFNDANKLFFRAKLGNKQFMVINKKKEKEYDAISGIQIKFGTGKTDFIYSYIGIKGNKYYLIYNGVESKGYEYIDEYPYYNYTNNSKVQYKAKDEYGFFLIINGKAISSRYSDIQLGDVSINGDFLNIATLSSGKFSILVNGVDKENGKYYSINNLIFSPDGKKYYYLFQKNEGDKYYIGLNGKELNESYEQIYISYSPFGKLFFQSITNEGKSYYKVNGKTENKYDETNGVSRSPDEKNYVYFGRIGEKWFTVVNGREIK